MVNRLPILVLIRYLRFMEVHRDNSFKKSDARQKAVIIYISITAKPITANFLLG